MLNDQLEFEFVVLEQTDLQRLEKKLDEVIESAGKVRRKLFGEMSAMKTQIALILQENDSLQAQIAELRGDKQEWDYHKDGCLFEMRVG